jgi:hypothetical protein
MVDVVLAEEELGVPIGLEERIRARVLFVDLVFVGVDQPGIRLCIDFQRDKGERVFSKRVVVIE